MLTSTKILFLSDPGYCFPLLYVGKMCYTQFSFRTTNEKRIIANYLKYVMPVIFELFHIYKRDPFLADSDDKSNEAKW